MKKQLLLLITGLFTLLLSQGLRAQCNAQFTWEQLPGTLQIHFHSTSTSEHDIVSFHWFFGDSQQGDGSNPYHTYAEAGTYNVCLVIEDNQGCVDEVCHMVTVAPIQGDCNASFNWEQLPGGLQIHFNSTSTSEHDIVSYHWNFGDGHEGDGASPYHTYDSAGVYLVCLIIEDETGCVSDYCDEVVVEGIPSECNAEFEWEQFAGTLEVDFINQSTSDHPIVSYHWNFGDGHSGDGASPSHTYEEPGVYLVCLIIENEAGCVSDVCHEVVVEGIQPGECNAEFEWEQIPGTQQIHFFSTSTSEHDIVSFIWHFGDGHEGDGNDPYHTYEEPGVYVVCLIIEDESGCVSDVCHEVVVEGIQPGECNAEFVWEQLPGTLQIHFISTSTSQHDIISYLWHFGDGHSGDGNDPYHTYEEPGVYVVCLRIEDNTGCVSEICHEEVVEEISGGQCHAQFVWEPTQDSLTIHFFSTSTSEHDIVSYHWIFGDGHEGDGSNPTHTYDSAGVYLVCLVIVDETGCVSDVCHEVVVGDPEGECHAEFTWEQIPGTLQIHFHSTSTSDHDIISYLWHFGDGHSGDGDDPYHTYEEPGVYVVCLRIEDNTGCVSEICHEVVVQAIEPEECQAQFTWEQIPGTLQIHFHSTSTSQYDIVSYGWNFGDGHQGDGSNPYHTYAEPGVYLVCLVIVDNNGCVSDICHEVVIEPLECNASFTFQVENDIVYFNNTSTGGTAHTQWIWNFGDGNSSSEENPQHEYAQSGMYTVCLIMIDTTNDCEDDFCQTLVFELGFEPLQFDEYPHGSQLVISASGSLGADKNIIRYTNPVDAGLFLEYLLEANSTVQIEIYNLHGCRVYDDAILQQAKGRHQESIDVRHLQPGLYLLSVTTSSGRQTVGFNVSR
jgi:PKD repeat protein